MTCDGSQRTALAGGVISQRLLHEPVQLASRGVLPNLVIPLLPVLLEQPLTQLRELIGTEFRDLLFELFDFSSWLTPKTSLA